MVEVVSQMKRLAEGQDRISQDVSRLSQEVSSLSREVVVLGEGQRDLKSGLSRITANLEVLGEGQRDLRAGLSYLTAKIEGELTDKVRALFAARDVSPATDHRTEAKLDSHGAIIGQLACHVLETEARITELRVVK